MVCLFLLLLIDCINGCSIFSVGTHVLAVRLCSSSCCWEVQAISSLESPYFPAKGRWQKWWCWGCSEHRGPWCCSLLELRQLPCEWTQASLLDKEIDGPVTPVAPANNRLPANLAAGHGCLHEPSKDRKNCPAKPSRNCWPVESLTIKNGCYTLTFLGWFIGQQYLNKTCFVEERSPSLETLKRLLYSQGFFILLSLFTYKNGSGINFLLCERHNAFLMRPNAFLLTWLFSVFLNTWNIS